MFELADSENDEPTRAEAQRDLASLRKEIDQFEVRTLLSGEYDAREALVTINAEAGGADAADFAQNLMRLYLRWAERHGYPVEVYDTSYAEEAGIKSATFPVKAPYAYGTLRVEQGTHRMALICKFNNPGRRQPPSPAWTWFRWWSRPITSRSTRTRSASTFTGPAGPAGRASTRPTRRCASPTCRPASSSSARTSAPDPEPCVRDVGAPGEAARTPPPGGGRRDGRAARRDD